MPAPYVDPAVIGRLTDDGGYRRGISYQRSGMVTRTSWDEAERVLTSVVAGSADHAYRCAIRFSAAGITASVTATSCTCPVPQACKHVVATLLVSNDDATLTESVAPDRPTPVAWRSLVPATAPDAPTAIALGVELRQRAHGGAHHWSPRPVRPVTPRDLAKGTGSSFSASARSCAVPRPGHGSRAMCPGTRYAARQGFSGVNVCAGSPTF